MFKAVRLARVFCALLVGASSAAMATTINVHANADIRSSDPGVNRDANTDVVVLQTVEGLVGYDARGEPKPMLAKAIEIGEDGRTYIFRLRDGVTFHNGAPLTADDVVWSWERFMDPKTNWRCRSDFDGRVRLKVESVVARDPATVIFTLNRSEPMFLSNLARTDCGMTAITHRSSLNADGTWNKPVGTGPFVFETWRSREYVTLRRFDHYASLPGEPDGYVGGKRPRVDEVRFIVIPDAATARAALLSGKLDILTRLPYAEAAELARNTAFKVYSSSTWSINSLLMQTQDPLLGRLEMRRAIALALDIPQLVSGASFGLAQPNPSIVPLTSSYHSDVQKSGYTQDVQAAKEALKQAGYRGERLVITANKAYVHHFDMAIIMQAMLAQVGINTDIEVVEWGTQIDKWQKGNYQLMAFQYSARLEPALSFESIMGPKATQPRKVWDEPDARKLLETAMDTEDRAVRQQAFDQLHRRAIAQVPLIPLFNNVNNDGVSTRVSGYRESIFGSPLMWEVSKQ